MYASILIKLYLQGSACNWEHLRNKKFLFFFFVADSLHVTSL